MELETEKTEEKVFHCLFCSTTSKYDKKQEWLADETFIKFLCHQLKVNFDDLEELRRSTPTLQFPICSECNHLTLHLQRIHCALEKVLLDIRSRVAQSQQDEPHSSIPFSSIVRKDIIQWGNLNNGEVAESGESSSTRTHYADLKNGDEGAIWEAFVKTEPEMCSEYGSIGSNEMDYEEQAEPYHTTEECRNLGSLYSLTQPFQSYTNFDSDCGLSNQWQHNTTDLKPDLEDGDDDGVSCSIDPLDQIEERYETNESSTLSKPIPKWLKLPEDPNKPFRCEVCSSRNRSSSFENQSGLVRHFEQYHKKEKPIFNCTHPDCSAKFCAKFLLTLHHNQSHQVKKRRRRTKIPTDSPKSIKNSNKNSTTDPQPTTAPQFKCDQCPKKCTSNARGISHHKSHAIKPLYKCSICGVTDSRSSRLKLHMRQHHNKLKSVHSCKFCNLTFYNKGHLTFHLRAKHREEEEACEYCGNIFSPSNLPQHKKKHLREGNSSVKCLKCKKFFTSPGDLKEHMLGHVAPIKVLKPVACLSSSEKS